MCRYLYNVFQVFDVVSLSCKYLINDITPRLISTDQAAVILLYYRRRVHRSLFDVFNQFVSRRRLIGPELQNNE